MRFHKFASALLPGLLALPLATRAVTVSNPFVYSDIPDISMVRANGAYWMVHTVMHYAPGVPIMKSTDLANWRIVGHAYQTLTNTNAMTLTAGASAYGKGSWASCIRFKAGTFYVLTPSYTTGKTHLYSTKDPEAGPWKEVLLPFYHDPSLVLDDDGRNYVVYGAGDIRIVELNADLSGVKSGGLNKLLYNNVAAPTGGTSSLGEGSQVLKKNGYYYIFNICWPSGMPRTVTVRRSKSLEGPFEAQTALKSSGGYDGVAQGSIIDMADGNWMGYLFTDQGGVGRCPWLVPVTWANDWPNFNGGTAPTSVNIAAATSPVKSGYGVTTSDDFSSPKMKIEWEWNHNPDNANWSLSARPGYYRITTSRTDAGILTAKNTLTHRSFGPNCSGRIALDASSMKDGDIAGLVALADSLGFVGVKNNGGSLQIVKYYKGNALETSLALNQKRAYLRIDMNMKTNTATFYYGTDSTKWNQIGKTMHMPYTLGMFVGYRFGLFNYATKSAGGYADFDWFQIGATVNETIDLYPGTTSVWGGSRADAKLGWTLRSDRSALDLRYALPAAGRVEMGIFDANGREVRRVDLGEQTAGLHQGSMGVSGIPGGRYYLVASRNGELLESRSVVLTK